MRTRTARPLIALAMTAALACASASPHGGRSGDRDAAAPVGGSDPALTPRITTAVARTNDLELAVRVPRAGYLTALRVYPREGMALLTPTAGERAEGTALDAGDHRLLLHQAPVFFAQNAVRASVTADHDAALRRNGIPSLPSPDYTVAVVTEQPVSWAATQVALADVDLARGSPIDVVARIARAVGAGSGGAWGASAHVTRTVW